MNEETPFLEALRANPNDVACRLVYADWLEERGDPRAELIRIEEEMRPLPVFSDRFWELKPRRHELRQRSDKDWLETMRYGTDCPPTFAHVPNGWKEWWRLIRVFTERWHGFPSLPDVGGHFAKVQAIEVQLRRALPVSVREWVAFAHDVRRSPDQHDVLRGLYRVQRLDDQYALCLFWETDRMCTAILQTDLGLQDPPVYGYLLEAGRDGFIPMGGPMLHSLNAYVLYYVVDCARGNGGGLVTDVDEASPLLRDLRTLFPAKLAFGRIEILDGENLLALIQPSDDEAASRRVSVQVFHPVSHEQIPDFLWEYTRDADSMHGVLRTTFRPDDKQGKSSMSVLISENDHPEELSTEQAVEAAYAGGEYNSIYPNLLGYVLLKRPFDDQSQLAQELLP